jgi:hypothetical protein
VLGALIWARIGYSPSRSLRASMMAFASAVTVSVRSFRLARR